MVDCIESNKYSVILVFLYKKTCIETSGIYVFFYPEDAFCICLMGNIKYRSNILSVIADTDGEVCRKHMQRVGWCQGIISNCGKRPAGMAGGCHGLVLLPDHHPINALLDPQRGPAAGLLNRHPTYSLAY